MKRKLFTLLAVTFVTFAFAQDEYVNIPDQNFKNYLLSIPALKTPGVSEITLAKAQAYAGEINCNNKSISDLTGIEAFKNIILLECSSNNLLTLDLSNNTALQTLNCMDNGLSDLNISGCTSLMKMTCTDNNLTSLDISNNTSLQYLDCSYNQLTNLDISNNYGLIGLSIESNNFKSFSVPASHTEFKYINCKKNEGLVYLNLKNMSELTNYNGFYIQIGHSGNYGYNVGFMSDFRQNPKLKCISVPKKSNGYYTGNGSYWNNIKDSHTCYNDSQDGCITPVFSQLSSSICAGVSFALPLISSNQIAGTWSPSTPNNQETTEYVFTPNAGCNTTGIVMKVEINPNGETPTFDFPTSLCQGSSSFTLPTTSTNGIIGSWSPSSFVNTTAYGTQTFVFMPNENDYPCTNSVNKQIEIVQNTQVAPTGAPTQTFTAGQTLADLSVNIASGTLVWYANSLLTVLLPNTTPLVDYATYYAVSSNGVCDSDALAITVQQTYNRTNFDLYGFSYYPNPTNDVLHLSSNQPIENVTISNMLGQTINVNLSSDKTSLDLSNLPTGNYLVKITIEGVSKTFKIIKK